MFSERPKKKQEIESRLSEIQKLLKFNPSDTCFVHINTIARTNITTDDSTPSSRPNQEPPTLAANSSRITEDTDIRSELQQIKNLLLKTLRGQDKLQKQVSEIKSMLRNYPGDNRILPPQTDRHTEMNLTQRNNNPQNNNTIDRSDFSIVQNFRAKLNQYYNP